jgi:hypothetical protein
MRVNQTVIRKPLQPNEKRRLISFGVFSQTFRRLDENLLNDVRSVQSRRQPRIQILDDQASQADTVSIMKQTKRERIAVQRSGDQFIRFVTVSK